MPLFKKPSDDEIQIKPSNEPTTEEETYNSVKDSLVNKTALSGYRDTDTLKRLLAYNRGHKVVVDYYKKLNSYINKQSMEVTFDLYSNPTNDSYQLIKQMEITLEEPLTVEQDPDTGEFTCTGVASIYPGVNPNIGDIFLLHINNTDIGVFLIDNVTKLTLYHDSFSSVNFHLYNVLNNTILDALNDRTVEEFIFEKDKYFTGNYSVLKSDEYVKLTDLQEFKKKLIEHIFNFYYTEDDIIIKPDGIFDANIVEFLLNKISLDDINKRPIQISPILKKDYKYSILPCFINTNYPQPKYKKYIDTFIIYDIFDTYVVGLEKTLVILDTLERLASFEGKFLAINENLTNDLLPWYIFTEDFYKAWNNETYDANNLTNFESLLIEVLKNNTYNFDNLSNIILNPFPTLNSDDNLNFYYNILSIELIDRFINYIGN